MAAAMCFFLLLMVGVDVTVLAVVVVGGGAAAVVLLLVLLVHSNRDFFGYKYHCYQRIFSQKLNCLIPDKYELTNHKEIKILDFSSSG